MAESLKKPTKKVTTITRIEETYEEVNENSPKGNPPPYSENPTDPPDDPDDPYKPMVKKGLTGPLAEASLPSLFDIFPLGTTHMAWVSMVSFLKINKKEGQNKIKGGCLGFAC